jgi:hypothetical protein
MIRYFTFCFLLLIISNSCFCQKDLLILQKKNKNTFYNSGDVISFKIEGDKSKITGKILDLEDSVIVFKGYEVNVNKITCLYVDKKTGRGLHYKLASLLLIGGSGYALIDLINRGELDERTLIPCGKLIAAGLLAKLIIGNKIKIKGRTRLRILNYNK